MSLQVDPDTGKITYRGREVGEHVFKDGRSVVRLTIEYEAGDEWIVPLSWLANGLSQLAKNQPDPSLLTVVTQEESIAEQFDVLRFLTEKQVKRRGYKWDFHKSDCDPWPSPLHGHDYDKGLKLDATTGKIYDVGTRTHCKTLKSKDLLFIQNELRASNDFKGAVINLIDGSSSTKGSA